MSVLANHECGAGKCRQISEIKLTGVLQQRLGCIGPVDDVYEVTKNESHKRLHLGA